ncbi:MAG: hypothetical protein K6D37_00510 [Prevotella sp.]|nr:hypothetical protein [Prevotella sp.]
MKRKAFMILTFPLMAASSWAQGQFGDISKTVDASDVEVTEVRYLQFMSHDSLVVNAETGTIDTLHIDDGRKVLTEEEYQQLASQPAMGRRRIAGVTPDTDQYGDMGFEGRQEFGSQAFLYSYKYPSVDANGNKVVLSALMGVPTGMLFHFKAKPENLVIGCHETITSNYECPTNYNHGGSAQSGNGMLLEYCRYDAVRQPCCLVILADYEGYGCTADRPHPYLYQELTARQVVDAVRYGLALYHSKDYPEFEDGWKSVCIGYSQGGSVSLATHKFIETNGLADELHFAGSVCGDGPYDPVAHVRYYVEDDGHTYHIDDGVEQKTEHKPGTLSMPIVMPLILKGMCDSNPMMRQHKLSDYLTDLFFATSSTKMIEAKSEKKNDDQYSTGRVTEVYRNCMNNGNDWTGTINNPYGAPITVGGRYDADQMAKMLFYDDGDNVWGKMDKMFLPECYAYLSNVNNFEDGQGNRLTPTGRGVMEDLHRALESNNLTVGWKPQHRVAFYHSTYDTVVPYANLLSFIKNQSDLTYFFYDNSDRHSRAGLHPTLAGKKDADVFVYDTPTANDHVAAGSDFYFYGASLYIAGESPDYWLYKWVLTGDN